MPLREGFVCAGTWSVEHVKTIARFPAAGEAVRIVQAHDEAGGSAFAMLAALRACAAEVPLYALGMIGDDEAGRTVLAACHKLEIDTFQLQTSAEAATGQAFVMHSAAEPARTRFYADGANVLLTAQHFAFKHCLAQWFHLSDFALLTGLHMTQEEPHATLVNILSAAQAAGLVTTMTCTRAQVTPQFTPALQQLDYLVLVSEANALAEPNTPALAEGFFQRGLRAGFAEIAARQIFAALRTGETTAAEISAPTAAAPPTLHARAAQFLYGRYAGWSLEQSCASSFNAK